MGLMYDVLYTDKMVMAGVVRPFTPGFPIGHRGSIICPGVWELIPGRVLFESRSSSFVNINNLALLNERWHKSKKKMDYSKGPDVLLLLDESFHLAQMNAFTHFFPKEIYCFVLPLELTKTLEMFSREISFFPLNQIGSNQSADKRTTGLMHLVLFSECISCQSLQYIRAGKSGVMFHLFTVL